MDVKNFLWFNCWLLAILLTGIGLPPVVAVQGITIIPVPDENAMVFDENQNGQADLEGDTWIFDQDSDGEAELIIVFRPEGHGVAYLYDDTNANAQVDYDMTDTGIQVLESYWRIKVERRHSSWYLPTDNPDWNLDVAVDSGFKKIGAEPRFELLDNLATDRQGRSAIDGATDFIIRYWDTDQDGIPEYEYNDVLPGGERYDAWMVNKNAHLQIQTTHRFPLLETVLKMDWQQARITRIQHLIPTRTNEAGYFLYFKRPTYAGEINAAWENPFAFYNLHGDHDGAAELKLRAVTEDYDRRRRNVIVYNEIRYSWAQAGNNPEYRLYLIGQVVNSETNWYPLYSVSHVSYEDLPSFVLTRPWKGAAFAEYESDTPRAFTEGIYENLRFTPALRDRLLDHRDIELPPYIPMYLRLREEYNFSDYQRQPRLYFSPIDQRLHLVGARQGIVIFSACTTGVSDMDFDFTDEELEEGNLLIDASVIYSDTCNDGYVDTWSYMEENHPITQLVFRRGAALLATESSIAIKHLPTSMGPSSWEALPPAEPTEWQMFQDRLAPAAADRRPMDDLTGMFVDLSGESFVLTPAELLNASVQPDKLVAHIATTGFAAPLPPSILTSLPQPIPAGEYVILDRQGNFWLEQPTPPQVQLSAITFSPTPNSLQDEPSGVIEFSVQNTGTLDAEQSEVVVEEESNAGLTTLLTQTVVIPAQGHTDFRIPWSPTFTGPRTILVKLHYDPIPGTEKVTLQEHLNLAAEVSGTTLEILYLSHGRLSVLIVLATILAGLLVIGTFLFVNEARAQCR